MIVSTDNPWQKIDEEVKYDNSWIKVTHSNVINPAGAKGIYGSVHFKNWAIGIIPLDKNLNTWIVGQYRYPIQQYSWEIPEGGGPTGVSTIETAKRELSEECGLKAKKWTRIQTFHLSNSVSDEYGEIFLAQDLEEFENHPDPEEELVIKKLSFEEVFQMVCKGEITDSISIMGIYKVRYLIENNLI
tara:strand:+ start:10885 stop:11445 length:561 start_codon:yes stop_codon:yes gene_type:complete